VLWGVPHHWVDIPRYFPVIQTHPNHFRTSPHLPSTFVPFLISSCGFW
jgi:hypothetical protein